MLSNVIGCGVLPGAFLVPSWCSDREKKLPPVITVFSAPNYCDRYGNRQDHNYYCSTKLLLLNTSLVYGSISLVYSRRKWSKTTKGLAVYRWGVLHLEMSKCLNTGGELYAESALEYNTHVTVIRSMTLVWHSMTSDTPINCVTGLLLLAVVRVVGG